MGDHTTLFCCPNRTLGTLSFPPTFPLDLDGPFAGPAGGQTGVDSTDPGFPLAFPAGLEAMIHRNWKPYKWDAIGSAVSYYEAQNYYTTPGPVTGGSTIVTTLKTEEVTLTFNETPFASTHIQPDFSIATNNRRMITWCEGLSDGPYPSQVSRVIDGVYIPYWDENGQNTTAFYVIATLTFYATLEPYFWQRNGSYYVEQTIRVDSSIGVYSSTEQDPIPDGWNRVEGAIFTGAGGGGSTRNELIGERDEVGTAQIVDLTGIDPVGSWGSAPLYASGDIPLPCSITLRVRTNFLPFPGY